MGRVRLVVAACVIAVAAVPGSASARDFAGTALNVIPSGQYGSLPIPAGKAARRQVQQTIHAIRIHFGKNAFGEGAQKLFRAGIRSSETAAAQ